MRATPRAIGPLTAGRLIRGLGATGVAALLLAACSPSSPPATTTTTTTSPTATTTTTTTTTPTTSTSVSVPVCASGSLRLAEDLAKSTQGAGSEDVAYTLTNTGSTVCTLDGFPTVVLFGAPAKGSTGAGPKLAITAAHSGAGASSVTLDAGAVGAFYLVVSDVPVDGVGCSSSASITVTPPGSSVPLAVSSSLAPCGPSVGVTAIVPLSALST
jgi:hypothetical protein